MSSLENKKIAIELLNGQKIFGVVKSWGKSKIWIIDESDNEKKDVPREIIQRALVVFDGEKE